MIINIATLKLNKEQLDWVDSWLSLWGAWVYSGRLDKRQSSIIAEYMATVEPQKYPDRPTCNDDDGMLMSAAIDSVMKIDRKAFGILLSYYANNSSRHAIATYMQKVAPARRMDTRGGNRLKKPSLSTCRREVDEILDASLYMVYNPLVSAFNNRKRVGKIKKVANWA